MYKTTRVWRGLIHTHATCPTRHVHHGDAYIHSRGRACRCAIRYRRVYAPSLAQSALASCGIRGDGDLIAVSPDCKLQLNPFMGRETKNKCENPKDHFGFRAKGFLSARPRTLADPPLTICVCAQAPQRAHGLIVGPRSRSSRRSFERRWLDPCGARTPHAPASSHPESEEGLLGVVAALTTAKGTPS